MRIGMGSDENGARDSLCAWIEMKILDLDMDKVKNKKKMKTKTKKNKGTKYLKA